MENKRILLIRRSNKLIRCYRLDLDECVMCGVVVSIDTCIYTCLFWQWEFEVRYWNKTNESWNSSLFGRLFFSHSFDWSQTECGERVSRPTIRMNQRNANHATWTKNGKLLDYSMTILPFSWLLRRIFMMQLQNVWNVRNMRIVCVFFGWRKMTYHQQMGQR